MNEPKNIVPSLPSQSPPHAVYSWRTEPEIDAERQKCLAERLTISPDIQQGIYPFQRVKLTRADIEWLLITHEGGRGPVDWNDVQQRERLGVDLRGADVRDANLRGLPLARMIGGLTRDEWNSTTPKQRPQAAIHLEGADLSKTHLEGAILRGANLQDATLHETNLQHAILFSAHLEGAYLREAHVEQANLEGAHLEGGYLRKAYLAGADLRNIFFDSATRLERVVLHDDRYGPILLADAHWGDANLSVMDWTQMKILGDESMARQQKTHRRTPQENSKRLEAYQAAVRAHRQLANAMRAQGMNEEALPFAYHAQVLQRKVFWQQMLWGHADRSTEGAASAKKSRQKRTIRRRIRSGSSYIFSCFLDLLAGYGYKPGRSLFIYLLMIASFATCYFVYGHLSPTEALIFSVTSFHGRGFLPGPFSLSSPITALAALEAVIGLFIEISFIATFTSRFFGR